ncbi:hypothetical protein SEPCBS57363_000102 [Sporothrix epigloea]|uniref:Triacylglycerol lipase N-terminal domain-containing protein n=1 Tax=Sporothrix epigloea TaxID=1892477 RepID=A0ABP0D4C7_9PEZI
MILYCTLTLSSQDKQKDGNDCRHYSICANPESHGQVDLDPRTLSFLKPMLGNLKSRQQITHTRFSMTEKGEGGSIAGADRPAYCFGFPIDSFSDVSQLPDYDDTFISQDDIDAFTQALAAPDPLQSPTITSAGPDDSNQLLGVGGASHSKRNSIVSNTDDAGSTYGGGDGSFFITAKNDWAPVHERVEGSESMPPATAHRTPFFSASSQWLPSWLTWRRRASAATSGEVRIGNGDTKKKRSRRQEQQQQRRRAVAASTAAGKSARGKKDKSGIVSLGRRTRDETREGYLYGLLKWPFLIGVFGWIIGLSITYLFTRMYIAMYEQLVTWRGRRERLRHRMRATDNYADWVAAASAIDAHLGNDKWQEENEFAFYDFRTVRRVADQLRRCRMRAEAAEADSASKTKDVADLRALVEACVKNNFAGIENRHLYSRTYYGTKNLVQSFIDEGV